MIKRPKNEFDVIICGAGPAGCAAGITLASRGLRVLLLDKSGFPREKPCGGLLTEKTYRTVVRDLGIQDLDTVIQHRAKGFELFEKQRHINSAVTPEHTYFAARREFDNLLFRSAREAGCKTILNGSIQAYQKNAVKINGDWFSFGYLVGADGVHSAVRKHLKLPDPKKGAALGMQVDIPASQWKPVTDWQTPKIFFGYVQYGWGWIFPKQETLSVGLAGLYDRPQSIKAAFDAFLADLSCAGHLKGNQVRGATIPYGTYLKKPFKHNVLLAGDAAGFVDPITGEGIYYALLSGRLAARAILESKNPPAAYGKRCRKEIIPHLKQALVARKFLFEAPCHAYALKKFSQNTKYMAAFMKVLSGTMDYKGYLLNMLRKKIFFRW